jgi:hypothetical protein
MDLKPLVDGVGDSPISDGGHRIASNCCTPRLPILGIGDPNETPVDSTLSVQTAHGHALRISLRLQLCSASATGLGQLVSIAVYTPTMSELSLTPCWSVMLRHFWATGLLDPHELLYIGPTP